MICIPLKVLVGHKIGRSEIRLHAGGGNAFRFLMGKRE